jgi:beta-galactosidase
VWQLPLVNGWNLLEARGKRGDAEVRDSVRVHFVKRAPRLDDPNVPFEEIAVNSGANVSYTDPQGLIWEADQEYKSGSWGYIGGLDQWKAIKGDTRADILGTTEDPLYQAVRDQVEGYRFDVPDGSYELELRFTEYFPNKPGQRIFRVICNGETLIERLDLAEAYGVRRAVSRTFSTRAQDGKGLNIRFEPIAGKPIISALRVRGIH